MNEPHAKPIEQMTDSELQRRIAELRGWIDIIYSASGYLLAHHPAQIVGERMRIPNWPQDTHAAVVDLLAEMEGLSLEYFRGQWVIAMTTKWIHSADTPARCISEAWIMWKEGQQ